MACFNFFLVNQKVASLTFIAEFRTPSARNKESSTWRDSSTYHTLLSALLRGKMEEPNKNIVRLISETEKLIQESKQLSERIKSFRRKERTTVGAAA